MEPQQPTETIKEVEEAEQRELNEEEGGEDEEFYEKIEAPKFVDFTVSDDPFRPDDRYWFCLRVGCDRKHEEELDPEEISKNFVLRVMAARSPNIRLRKALNGRNTSTNVKCPLSAPAKSSKPRVSRLAMVSSLSQKMLDVNGKVRTLPKISSTSTPTVKTKQVAAKYMTTPRNKRCLPNQNSFRSVQNPSPTTVAVPKSRLVAKALVFNSPKKAITLKTLVELRTPLTKLCEGMKRLEITSQRKRVLGYASKSSKGTRCDPQKSLPVNPSRRQQSVRNDKSGAKDMFRHHNRKDQETKSMRKVMSKSRQLLTKKCDSVPKKMSENDSSDMEIDVKSRDGSTLDSVVIKGNEHEEHLKTTKISGNVDSRDSKEVVLSEVLHSRENSNTLTNSSRGEMNSLPNSEGMDLPRSHDLIEEGVEGSERIEQENNTKTSSENDGSHEDNLALQGVGKENEVMDSDDKENTQASDENRDFNHNNNQRSERKFLDRPTHENNKKVVQTVDKNLKDGLTSATTGAPDVKYRKPKPTNPKPFRLRTDERGILKEANNMERKIQAPQKQAATVSRFLGGNTQRRRGNDIKRDEKCSEQSKCSSDVLECSDKESQKKVQKVESKWSRTPDLQTSRGKTCRTPQRCFKSLQPEHNNKRMSQKSENSLRKRQSPSVCRQLVRPQGKVMASLITPGQRLTVIKETSSEASKSKSAGKAHEGGVTTATKASGSASSRPSSQGRRPLTVPKEPNFHSAHKPKSCTA